LADELSWPALAALRSPAAGELVGVDLQLVIAIDVSSSMNESRLLRRHLSGNFTEARLDEPLMQQLRRLGRRDRRAVVKALHLRGRWRAAQQVSLLLRLHSQRDNIDA
jgi:hypothetical protein